MASFKIKYDFRKSLNSASRLSRSASKLSNNPSPACSTPRKPKASKPRKSKPKTMSKLKAANQSSEKDVPILQHQSNNILDLEEEKNKKGYKNLEDLDPLSSVEIKSAAQWKAISRRISWKEDQPMERERHSERRFRTHRHRKPRLNKAITIKFPELTDYPENVQQEATTLSYLRSICWRVKPWDKSSEAMRDKRLFRSVLGEAWGVDCDEIMPGLFIGDKASATNIQFLKRQSIDHVLNVAEGKGEGLVDIFEDDYHQSNISYTGLPLWDNPICNIGPYLAAAADIINDAIVNDGKIIVTCQMGVSRSASCLLAYLMIHQNMSLNASLTLMRQCRDVRPNDGFLKQLIILDLDLKMEREKVGDGESRLVLATKDDLQLLPKPWNFEFFVGDINEEDIEGPLVSMDEPCPLRLSGFSSLNDTPSCSTSISRQSYGRPRHHYHQESRSRSYDILEETDDELRTDIDSADDLLASGDELDDKYDAGLPILEKVKEIIEEPEDRWRFGDQEVDENEQDKSSSSNGDNPAQVQPKEEDDILSLLKIKSASQWKSISKSIDIDLSDVCPNECKEKDQESGLIEETSRTQLLSICWKVKPWECPKDSRLFTSLYAAGWGVDCDEVYPGLYIGDKHTAKNIRFLNKIGITHVLNAAEGPWEDFGFVNLNQDYFKDTSILYQGLCLWDTLGCDISPYFGPAAQFIHHGLSSGGKVLVNCQMGVSRSSALAMSYMMLYQGWSAVQTMTEFRKRRDVRPNDDFIDQLVSLDNQLKRTDRNKETMNKVTDIPHLPKPWHFEFWKVIPDQSDLPFKLIHLGEPSDDFDHTVGILNPQLATLQQIEAKCVAKDSDFCEEKKSYNFAQIELADLNPFKFSVNESLVSSNKSRTESESSWEYYSDSEDDI